MQSLFFKENIINWHPVNSIFANMKHIGNSPSFSDSILLNKKYATTVCKENCSLFSNSDECVDYCDTLVKSFHASNTLLSPCQDIACCKHEAGTNDFAFRMCRNQIPKKLVPSNKTILLFVCLIVLIFVLKSVGEYQKSCQ